MIEPGRVAALVALLLGLTASPALAEKPLYVQQLPVFWSRVYPEGGHTLYCGVGFKPFDKRVNVEHVFPMAWVTRSLGCGNRRQCQRSSDRFNQIESDMHNLYPALSLFNKARSAYAFAELPGEQHWRRDCDFEIDEDRRLVEPRPAVRGDIARAMLYMAETYGLEIYPRQLALLQRWQLADPPDAEERRRNRVIALLQGRRNRFIDQH